MRLSLGIHSPASVIDADHDVVTVAQGGMTASLFLTESDVTRLNRKFPARGHGIADIYCEIHDDLFDLPGIGADRPEICPWAQIQIDIFADHAREHLQVFSGNVVEIENVRREHLLA